MGENIKENSYKASWNTAVTVPSAKAGKRAADSGAGGNVRGWTMGSELSYEVLAMGGMFVAS